MEYLWRPASGPLAEVVAGYWHLCGPAPARVERILPMPTIHLIFNLSPQPYLVRADPTGPWRQLGPVFCSGLRNQLVLSANPAFIVNAGAVIHADGLPALGVDPNRLAGEVVDLNASLPGGPDDDGEAVLDRVEALLEERLQLNEIDPIVRGAIGELTLRPATPISVVATNADVSHPTLVARFRRRTGITPKLFAELVRFHRMLDRLAVPEDVVWSRLATESGYYDQSHATRSFRQFAGLTPADYYRRVCEAGIDSVRFVPDADASLPRD